MAQVKIKNEEVLSKERYTLKRYTFDIQKQNGEWETQEREVFDHGNAVTVLLYNKEKQCVLLTKQFRIATYINGNATGMLIETPAGMVEGEEDPAEAMIREVEEETGYKIPEVKRIYEAYSSGGAFTELIHFFVAPYNEKQRVSAGGGLEEEGEELNVMEVLFEKALQMIESGEIKDAKTIMLLHYAQVKQLL